MDTLGLFLPMMMLVSKTGELIRKSGQDSFTSDEISELMAKAARVCIADIQEVANKREEKKNASTDKEKSDGE